MCHYSTRVGRLDILALKLCCCEPLLAKLVEVARLSIHLNVSTGFIFMKFTSFVVAASVFAGTASAADLSAVPSGTYDVDTTLSLIHI